MIVWKARCAFKFPKLLKSFVLEDRSILRSQPAFLLPPFRAGASYTGLDTCVGNIHNVHLPHTVGL